MRMGFCLDFSLPGGVGGEARSQQVKPPPQFMGPPSVVEAPGGEPVPSLGGEAGVGQLLA